jgi:acyl CoA:acetate/3-ketoacid CoA transferase beta subunit
MGLQHIKGLKIGGEIANHLYVSVAIGMPICVVTVVHREEL